MKSKRMALKALRALSDTPTYRPLKRGRYKYNQSISGGILKKGQVDSHRRSLIKRNGGASSSGVTAAKLFPIAKWRFNFSSCPICNDSNHGPTGLTKCRQCRNVYRAVNQSEITYINRIGGIHALCPRCNGKNRNPDLNSENVCTACGKKYYVIS
jgi:hypothetical protein